MVAGGIFNDTTTWPRKTNAIQIKNSAVSKLDNGKTL